MSFFNFLFQLILAILQFLLLLLCPAFWPIRQFNELISPPPVFSASSVPQLLFVDDFSSGLGQWQLENGSWHYWQINQDGWLEASINTPQTVSVLVPKDEFWQSDWLDYQLEFDFEVLSSADINFSWGFQDINNWYEIHFFDGNFYLVRVENGQTEFYYSGEFDLPLNTVCRAYIVFNQGQIQVWIDDNPVVDYRDFSYKSGGKIALRVTTGAAFPTKVRFNNLMVYSFPVAGETILPLTAYKQTQQPWANQEYNHALSWRRWGNWQELQPPTPPERVGIYHWGCAMTSLAMVMNYHGLATLPSGENLNPGTLNDWLKKQADGYIGEGLLNWLAGARLSRLIQDKFSTPLQPLSALEFQRYYSSTHQVAIDLIDSNRPAIVQIPGHFLVAHGYTLSKDDLIISDPAYNYFYFSQHQQPLVSLIDFQPTQTDLSYLMLVYDPRLEIKLLDENFQLISHVFYGQDTIADPFYDHEQCSSQLIDEVEDYCFPFVSAPIIQYLQQPDTGRYYLEIFMDGELLESEVKTLQPWQIFAYGIQGEASIIDRHSFLETELVVLDFDQHDPSQVMANSITEPDFIALQQSLQTIENFSEISPYLYFRLQEIVKWSLAAEVPQEKDRYLQLILSILAEFELQVSQALKQSLLSVLL